MKKKKGMNRERKETIAGYLFIAPIFIGFIVLILIPVVFSLILSFTEWNFLSGFKGIKFVGVDNFISIFHDDAFKKAVWNTVKFAVGTITLQVSLGLILAVILTSDIFGEKIFKTMIFVPYISSMVAVSIVWKVMLHPTLGPINKFLAFLGVEELPKWFASVELALPTIILFTVWQALGYFTIVYIAGLKSIPEEIYEATKIDGASAFKQFTKITIPLVSPTTFFLTITGLIGCFRAFDQISVTTNGGPGNASSVIVMFVYKNAFEFFKMGYASAAAWILFILVFGVTVLQWIGQKNWVNYD